MTKLLENEIRTEWIMYSYLRIIWIYRIRPIKYSLKFINLYIWIHQIYWENPGHVYLMITRKTDKVHWHPVQLRRKSNPGICMQARGKLLWGTDVKACLALGKHGYVTLERVYDQYLIVTYDDGGNDTHN